MGPNFWNTVVLPVLNKGLVPNLKPVPDVSSRAKGFIAGAGK